MIGMTVCPSKSCLIHPINCCLIQVMVKTHRDEREHIRRSCDSHLKLFVRLCAWSRAGVISALQELGKHLQPRQESESDTGGAQGTQRRQRRLVLPGLSGLVAENQVTRHRNNLLEFITTLLAARVQSPPATCSKPAWLTERGGSPGSPSSAPRASDSGTGSAWRRPGRQRSATLLRWSGSHQTS